MSDILEKIAMAAGTALINAFGTMEFLVQQAAKNDDDMIKRLENIVPVFRQIAEATKTSAPNAFLAIQSLAEKGFFRDGNLQELQNAANAFEHIARYSEAGAPNAFRAFDSLVKRGFFDMEGVKKLQIIGDMAKKTKRAMPAVFWILDALAAQGLFWVDGISRLEKITRILERAMNAAGEDAAVLLGAIQALARKGFFHEESIDDLMKIQRYFNAEDINGTAFRLERPSIAEEEAGIFHAYYVFRYIEKTLKSDLSPGALTLLIFDLRDWEAENPGKWPDHGFMTRLLDRGRQLLSREKAAAGAPTIGGKIHFRRKEMSDRQLEHISELLKDYDIYSPYQSIYLSRRFPMPEVAGFIYLPVTRDAGTLAELIDRVSDLLEKKNLLPKKTEFTSQNLWFQLTIAGKMEAPFLYINFANLLARNYILPEETWPERYPDSFEAIGPLAQGGGILEGDNESWERHDDLTLLYFYDKSTPEGNVLHDEIYPQIEFWQTAELAYNAWKKARQGDLILSAYEHQLALVWEDPAKAPLGDEPVDLTETGFSNFFPYFQSILDSILTDHRTLSFKPNDRPTWPEMRKFLIMLSREDVRDRPVPGFSQWTIFQFTRLLRRALIQKVRHLQDQYRPDSPSEESRSEVRSFMSDAGTGKELTLKPKDRFLAGDTIIRVDKIFYGTKAQKNVVRLSFNGSKASWIWTPEAYQTIRLNGELFKRGQDGQVMGYVDGLKARRRMRSAFALNRFEGEEVLIGKSTVKSVEEVDASFRIIIRKIDSAAGNVVILVSAKPGQVVQTFREYKEWERSANRLPGRNVVHQNIKPLKDGGRAETRSSSRAEMDRRVGVWVKREDGKNDLFVIPVLLEKAFHAALEAVRLSNDDLDQAIRQLNGQNIKVYLKPVSLTHPVPFMYYSDWGNIDREKFATLMVLVLKRLYATYGQIYDRQNDKELWQLSQDYPLALKNEIARMISVRPAVYLPWREIKIENQEVSGVKAA
ncbi:MAG TPA: hypothetical protein VD913_05725, partial [bacterium]|nr:hypothetical protein [bacterium]